MGLAARVSVTESNPKPMNVPQLKLVCSDDNARPESDGTQASTEQLTATPELFDELKRRSDELETASPETISSFTVTDASFPEETGALNR